MTNNEAATIIAILHGAFPRAQVDDAVTEVWMNSLMLVDYEAAMLTVEQWIETERFWPTVAEFNTRLRSIRQSLAGKAIPRTSAIHCDGSGWFDRGIGWEACPTCNTWNEQLIKDGNWNDTTVQPPLSWVQPRPCKPHHVESQLFSFEQAKAAVEQGYREHHSAIGTDSTIVDERVQALMERGVAIGEERDGRSGSSQKRQMTSIFRR